MSAGEIKIVKDNWVEYRVDGRPHRDDEPAAISYHPNGQSSWEIWFQHGKRHRIQDPSSAHKLPAEITHYPDGRIQSQAWWEDGRPKCYDGSPSLILYRDDGTILAWNPSEDVRTICPTHGLIYQRGYHKKPLETEESSAMAREKYDAQRKLYPGDELVGVECRQCHMYMQDWAE